MFRRMEIAVRGKALIDLLVDDLERASAANPAFVDQLALAVDGRDRAEVADTLAEQMGGLIDVATAVQYVDREILQT